MRPPLYQDGGCHPRNWDNFCEHLFVDVIRSMVDFNPGDRVRLTTPLPYLKTADVMPMLRPADLVDPIEIGTLLERRPGGRWAVQFERGNFLIDHENLALAAQLSPESSHPQTHQSPPSH